MMRRVSIWCERMLLLFWQFCLIPNRILGKTVSKVVNTILFACEIYGNAKYTNSRVVIADLL